MFRILITEILSLADGEPEATIERYSQIVDRLDLLRLIEIVNAKPPRVRVRKAKAPA